MMRTYFVGTVVAVLSAAGVLEISGSWGTARVVAQEQRQCLHGADESDAEKARRQGALRLTRAINTAESVAFTRGRTYAPLGQLQVPAPPGGFVPALATDGQAYVFSIKDSLDPCRFAFFSDQNGLIYVAQPLQ